MGWTDFQPILGRDVRTKEGELPLTLKRSVESKMLVDRVTGSSWQKTLTGKNLYDGRNLFKSITNNGVTIKNNNDGTCTVTGTATANVNALQTPFTLPAGTYTYTPIKSANDISVCLYNRTDATFVAYSIIKTFTIDTAKEFDIRLQTDIGTTVNSTVSVQIELGSVATEYEPFCGGVPSPNPDYSQEIKSLGVKTNNLYDVNSLYDNALITVDKDGWINFTINASNGSSVYGETECFSSIIEQLKPSTQYAVVLEIASNPDNCVVNVTGYTTDMGQWKRKGQFTTSHSATAVGTHVFTPVTYSDFTGITSGLNTYIRYSAKTICTVKFRISILEDTTVTADTFEYKPFGSLITVKTTGKNLFSGWIKGIGISSTTGEETTDSTRATTDYIKIDLTNNSYFISGLSDQLYSFVSFYDKDKNYLYHSGGADILFLSLYANRLLTGGATLTTDAKYIRITQYEISLTSGNIDLIDSLQTQLELGSEATQYEPYRESIITIPLSEPLRSKGNVKDEICYQDGKYGVLRRIVEWVADGSDDELWVDRTSDYKHATEGQCRFSNTKTLPFSYNAYRHNVAMSNIGYTNIPGQRLDIETYSVAGLSLINSPATTETVKTLYITTENPNITDLSTFISWLSANPVTVQYEMYTPIFEPFKDQTVFYNLSSHDRITHVFISEDTTNLEPEIVASYAVNSDGKLILDTYTDGKLLECEHKEDAADINAIIDLIKKDLISSNRYALSLSDKISTANTNITNLTNKVSTANTNITNLTTNAAKALYVSSFDSSTGILNTVSADKL